MATFPLFALLNDSVLPNEARLVTEDTLDADGRARVERLGEGADACVVGITSVAEFPSMVEGRWATLSKVSKDKEGATTFTGVARVRILKVRSDSKGTRADTEPGPVDADVTALVRAVHMLIAAMDAEGAALDPELAKRFRVAASAIARAATSDARVRDLVDVDLTAGISNLASQVARASAGAHATCALESATRELIANPSLPPLLRRKLWSQLVEIQRRLDLFDPDEKDDLSELSKLKKKLGRAGLPKHARAAAKSAFKLLSGMEPSHHDYTTHFSRLSLIANLPWHPASDKTIDLASVSRALDESHSGLEDVKKRVLEHLAVHMLGGTTKSTVLCLSGPPGVGKTTVAQAIAKALRRPFVRVALGGVHDEAEVRGHRMSFTAAAAGRLLAGLATSPTNDAVLLLDEIDKIGTERTRSPAAALLEVLDPAQNEHFQDNFLALPYDLSNVFFIATANDPSRIEPALLDRLEPIELEGYAVREKKSIVREHLLTRLTTEHGLTFSPEISDAALSWIIVGHTREAGVRQLHRALARIFRSLALDLARGIDPPRAIDEALAERVLGSARYLQQKQPDSLPVGVSTALAVIAGSGALLRIEVGTVEGKGELMTTGSLGDVMSESVQTVLGHLRLSTREYGLTRETLTRDVYLHAPDAALPKDGPSAGLAIFVSLLSAFRNEPARADTALTGEVSLTGEVLPVGGLRAKVLAAERAGVSRVVVPRANEGDVPKDTSLEVIFASHTRDAARAAFRSSP